MLNPLVKILTDDKIQAHVSDSGPALLQTPGDVLGSGWDSIAPGNVYVLGFNPGGRADDDENSVAQSLENASNDKPYSIYCDEVWPRGGKTNTESTTISAGYVHISHSWASPMHGALRPPIYCLPNHLRLI